MNVVNHLYMSELWFVI